MKRLKDHPECIQIAGIVDLREAQLLIDEGVDAIGFPLGLSVHKEDLSSSQVLQIVQHLPDQILPILITYLNTAKHIYEICQATGIKTIQIHGSISTVEIKKLLSLNSAFQLIKSLVVKHKLIKLN